MPRGRTRGDELRLHYGGHRCHELFDWQIDCQLSVPVLFYERSSGIEDDVDAPGLLCKAVDVLIDGGVIERVEHGHMSLAAGGCDFFHHPPHPLLSSPPSKNLPPYRLEPLRN